MPSLAFLFALLLGAAPAGAQFVSRTWLAWRTIETEHFLVHYPTELEEWARATASRVESIDSAVTRLVGHRQRGRTHVVIDDPYSAANGSAWPTIGEPAVVLWAQPPSPRDAIGTFANWSDLLATHELAHIAHLTWETRNPMQRLLLQLLPANLGPVARKSPRWVIEGFATYVEGRLTGSGRPNGSWRPAILRQFALEGQLPTYAQLDGTAAYMGGEMTYLAGSAFLEWLVRNNGDSSLVHLWRRMSARTDRSFAVAFAGVFGETPDVLYGRFSAELSGKAADAREAIVGAGTDSGRMIQHLLRDTGDPAISSEGGRVALVIRSRGRPPRTVIWKTIDEPDTMSRRLRERMTKIDSLDVPARSIYPPPKKAVATLVGVGGQAYESPRFFRDGRVLLWRNTARGNGSYRPDLYVWDPQRGTVRRVTHGAGVRDGDPSPDGERAVATQCIGGTCALVEVTLATGAVRVLARRNDASFYRPRYSPDGQRIIVALNDGRWRLGLYGTDGVLVRDVASGESHVNRFDAAFVDDNTIVAVSDADGIHAVERIDLRSGAARVVARTTGAAVAPEPNPSDGSIWFLSLHARGYDLRASAPASATVDAKPLELGSRLYPVVPAGTAALSRRAEGAIAPSSEYGIGPRKWRWAPAGVGGADGATAMLALINTDIVGRGELLAVAGLSQKNAWNGGSITATWRGTRPTASVTVFGSRQRASEARLRGAFAWIDGNRSTERSALRFVAGLSGGDADTPLLPTTRRALAVAQGALALRHYGEGATVTWSVNTNGATGTSFGRHLDRIVVASSLDVGGATVPLPFLATVTFGSTRGSAFEQFSLGGLPAPVVHPLLLTQRVTMPVLASGTDEGDGFTTMRLSFPFIGFRAYAWAGRTHRAGGFGDWHHVHGLEWTGSLPAIGTAGSPAVRASAGIGRVADTHAFQAYLVMGLGEIWR